MRGKAVDLFCGAGGMGLGVERAGFDVVAAVDVDPVHAAVHSYNFPVCRTVCGDLTKMSAKEIYDGPVDLVFGGPPCQGFSNIGRRNVDDARNQLVGHFLRLVGEFRPRAFIFENVPGLIEKRNIGVIEWLSAEFSKLGYTVPDWKVLDASDFEIPQSRERLFLIGTLDGKSFQYPTGSGRRTSVREAIGDLPNVDDFEELLKSDEVICRFGIPSSYAGKLRDMRPGLKDLLTCSARTTHCEAVRLRFQKTPPGKFEPVSNFFKLDPDGLCNTLRAGTGPERGSFTSPRPIHYEHARCVTVREMARMHSYPDWFRFHKTNGHGARQIGNSVPPLLAEELARALGLHLNVLPTPSIDPTKDVRFLGMTLTQMERRGAFRTPEACPVQTGDPRLLRMTWSQAARHFGLIPRYPQRKKVDHEKRTP